MEIVASRSGSWLLTLLLKPASLKAFSTVLLFGLFSEGSSMISSSKRSSSRIVFITSCLFLGGAISLEVSSSTFANFDFKRSEKFALLVDFFCLS